MYDLEDIGDPSMFNVIRSVSVLTRMLSTLDLSVGRTPCGGSGTGHGQIV